MKAKEYAVLYKQTPSATIFIQHCSDMIKEMAVLAKQRKVGTMSSMKSVIDEVEDKWKSYCRLIGREDMYFLFRASVEFIMSKTPAELEQYVEHESHLERDSRIHKLYASKFV